MAFFSGDFQVVVACLDRAGNEIRRLCDYTVCFEFQPSGGPCREGVGIGSGTATLGDCREFCPS